VVAGTLDGVTNPSTTEGRRKRRERADPNFIFVKCSVNSKIINKEMKEWERMLSV